MGRIWGKLEAYQIHLIGIASGLYMLATRVFKRE